eukprot:g2392.t1
MVPRGPAVPLVALRVLLVLALGGGVRARAAAGHGARNRELFEALRARVELDVLVAPRASGGTERSKAEPPRAMRLVDSFGRSLRCAAENAESGSGAAEVPVAAPGAPRESRRKQSASSAATSSINSRSEQTDEVAVNLDFLASECAQKQLGWWTYRWCHLQSVRQFHVEKDGTLAAETSLGLFDETASNAVNLKKQRKRGKKRDKRSKGAVVDPHTHIFSNGDMCSETSKPRKTEVRFKCCNPDKGASSSSSSSVSGGSVPNAVSIQSIQEPTTCSYLLTLCTPHACRAGERKLSQKGSAGGSSGSNHISSSSSIVSLLKRMKGSCFRLLDGWWTYEFCYGSHLRQMHIQIKDDDKTGNQVQEVQSMYELGKWSGVAISADEEQEHVVHLPSLHTDPAAGARKVVAFKEEYDGGGMCELTGKPRSTTVYFVCRGGSGLTSRILSVKEDSSCHYLIELHSAHLCVHPLFSEKADVSTTIKCTEEDGEETGQ